MSVNDPRGPSIDLRTTKAKAKKAKAVADLDGYRADFGAFLDLGGV
mgnify:CR=1 FL=1